MIRKAAGILMFCPAKRGRYKGFCVKEKREGSGDRRRISLTDEKG